jgi:hypothetical protein
VGVGRRSGQAADQVSGFLRSSHPAADVAADVAAGFFGAAGDALDVHLGPEPHHVRRPVQLFAGLVEGGQQPKYCTSQPTQRRVFGQNRFTGAGKWIASRAAAR